MDHGVRLGHEAVDERGVADVAHDELDAVRGQARDVVGVAGVGQLVEHGDVDAGVLAHDMVDEVGADGAAALAVPLGQHAPGTRLARARKASPPCQAMRCRTA